MAPILIQLSRKKDSPLYRQIVDQVKSSIDAGDLPPGSTLPPSRQLAEQLGIDRSTVCEAYAELQALGYIRSRPGSYHYAEKRRREVAYDPQRPSTIAWAEQGSAESSEVLRAYREFSPRREARAAGDNPRFDLASIDPDPRLYPLRDFRRSVRHVLDAAGTECLQYGDPQGYEPLRETIARRLRLHGISVSKDEILVTHGAQQGIDLLARLFSAPGRSAVVESPTYSFALPLLRFNRLEVVGVPMTPEGMDLDGLARTLGKIRAAFVYTMPNFHNPTCITTSHRHRERLLDLCFRRNVPIVEDGFEEEMKYGGPVALPLKSIDAGQIVVYLGTFSKVLFPGLRIGWITADKELIGRLLAIKRFSDLTTNAFGQRVMHRFCELGLYDRNLRRLHRLFKRKMAVALEALEASFPAGTTWTRPSGGYAIWVTMPKKFSAGDLLRRLAPSGEDVSPGEPYFPRGGPSAHFRLSIARPNEAEIGEAIGRLGRALRAFC